MKLHHIFEAKYAQDHGVIELTQAPRTPNAEKKKFDKLVNDAWTAGVEYKGENVFNLVYESGLADFLEKELKSFHEDQGRDFDGQESYLGYIPSEDAFVMGWDLWVAHRDDYGDEERVEDAENMVLFTVYGGGVDDHEVLDRGFSFMYSAGYNYLHQTYPSIVDVRLD